MSSIMRCRSGLMGLSDIESSCLAWGEPHDLETGLRAFALAPHILLPLLAAPTARAVSSQGRIAVVQRVTRQRHGCATNDHCLTTHDDEVSTKIPQEADGCFTFRARSSIAGLVQLKSGIEQRRRVLCIQLGHVAITLIGIAFARAHTLIESNAKMLVSWPITNMKTNGPSQGTQSQPTAWSIFTSTYWQEAGKKTDSIFQTFESSWFARSLA